MDGFGPPTEAERRAGNTGLTEAPRFLGSGEGEAPERLRVILSGRANRWIVTRTIDLPRGANTECASTVTGPSIGYGPRAVVWLGLPPAG